LQIGFLSALHFFRPETAKGLRVNTRLLRKQYEKGEELPDQQMRELVLTNHTPLPAWNDTLTPATM
jgi:hypothetical protein